MMNRWGNDDRGPGGDPSWLGGKDRGDANSQGSGSWSSDFASTAHGPDSDFGGGRDAQAAEQMAPRFGDVTGDDARTKGSGSDSPWLESFTGQDTEGSGSGKSSGLSRVLGTVLPLIVVVVFGIIFLRMAGGDGFSGFGAWWIFLVIGIPFLRRIVRTVRKRLGG